MKKKVPSSKIQVPKGKAKTPAARSQASTLDPRPSTEFVHSSVIREITGYDEAALRRLAGKGIIPRPKISQWPFVETLTKLFAHLSSSVVSRQSSLPVFDSMDSCEGAGFFSKKFLQVLKAAGLPGFENTRVDFSLLIPAIEPFLAGAGASEAGAVLQGEGVVSWAEMRQKFQALLAKLDHEEAVGRIVDKETAVDTVRELQTIHHHSRARTLEEWPNMLAGRNAADIRTHIEKANKALDAAEEASINGLEKTKGKRNAECGTRSAE